MFFSRTCIRWTQYGEHGVRYTFVFVPRENYEVRQNRDVLFRRYTVSFSLSFFRSFVLSFCRCLKCLIREMWLCHIAKMITQVNSLLAVAAGSGNTCSPFSHLNCKSLSKWICLHRECLAFTWKCLSGKTSKLTKIKSVYMWKALTSWHIKCIYES